MKSEIAMMPSTLPPTGPKKPFDGETVTNEMAFMPSTMPPTGPKKPFDGETVKSDLTFCKNVKPPTLPPFTHSPILTTSNQAPIVPLKTVGLVEEMRDGNALTVTPVKPIPNDVSNVKPLNLQQFTHSPFLNTGKQPPIVPFKTAGLVEEMRATAVPADPAWLDVVEKALDLVKDMTLSCRTKKKGVDFLPNRNRFESSNDVCFFCQNLVAVHIGQSCMGPGKTKKSRPLQPNSSTIIPSEPPKKTITIETLITKDSTLGTRPLTKMTALQPSNPLFHPRCVNRQEHTHRSNMKKTLREVKNKTSINNSKKDTKKTKKSHWKRRKETQKILLKSSLGKTAKPKQVVFLNASTPNNTHPLSQTKGSNSSMRNDPFLFTPVTSNAGLATLKRAKVKSKLKVTPVPNAVPESGEAHPAKSPNRHISPSTNTTYQPSHEHDQVPNIKTPSLPSVLRLRGGSGMFTGKYVNGPDAIIFCYASPKITIITFTDNERNSKIFRADLERKSQFFSFGMTTGMSALSSQNVYKQIWQESKMEQNIEVEEFKIERFHLKPDHSSKLIVSVRYRFINDDGQDRVMVNMIYPGSPVELVATLSKVDSFNRGDDVLINNEPVKDLWSKYYEHESALPIQELNDSQDKMLLQASEEVEELIDAAQFIDDTPFWNEDLEYLDDENQMDMELVIADAEMEIQLQEQMQDVNNAHQIADVQNYMFEDNYLVYDRPPHSRLNGGALGICCNPDCSEDSSNLCATCNHFICFFCKKKFNGVYVCPHCSGEQQEQDLDIDQNYEGHSEPEPEPEEHSELEPEEHSEPELGNDEDTDTNLEANDYVSGLLHKFGHNQFRNREQKEGVMTMLEGQLDMLVLMPTSSGKSLVYQLPAIAVTDKVTLVVSPLLALIKDQVDHLTRCGIVAECINSRMSRKEKQRVIDDLNSNLPKTRLLYVTPECCATPNFHEMIKSLVLQQKIAMFILDEAHCLSEYGHSFRVDYRKLGNLREILTQNIPWCALTATAPQNVIDDIITTLQFRPGYKIIKLPSLRKNLFYDVVFKDPIDNHKNYDDLANFVKSKLQAGNDCGIVYCSERKETEFVVKELSDRGIVCLAYHGGMNVNDRTEIQDQWMTGDVKVIAATSAFGMGVDKATVRFVAHWTTPQTCSAYYQESGRAGRDGRLSFARLFFSYKDSSNLKAKVYRNCDKNLNEEGIRFMNYKKDSLKIMTMYGESLTCRHKLLAQYFGDKVAECGDMCDTCVSINDAKDKLNRFLNGPTEELGGEIRNCKLLLTIATNMFTKWDDHHLTPATHESSFDDDEQYQECDTANFDKEDMNSDYNENDTVEDTELNDENEEIIIEDSNTNDNRTLVEDENEDWSKCFNCEDNFTEPINHLKRKGKEGCLKKYVDKYKIGKKCLNCNEGFQYPVPHMNRKDRDGRKKCLELYSFLYKVKYGNKYDLRNELDHEKEYQHNLRTLQKIFKIERQRKKRNDPQDMNSDVVPQAVDYNENEIVEDAELHYDENEDSGEIIIEDINTNDNHYLVEDENEDWSKCFNCKDNFTEPMNHLKRKGNEGCLKKYVDKYNIGNKCLNCNEGFQYPVAHMNRKERDGRKKCLELYSFLYKVKYGNKYDLRNEPDHEKEYQHNLKTLQKIFKIERQRKKRNDPQYRKEQNLMQKKRRKMKNADARKCYKEYEQAVQQIMSRECGVCRSFSSDAIEIENKSNLFKDLLDEELIDNVHQVFFCKVCMKLKLEVETMREFEDTESELGYEYKEWARKQLSLKRKVIETKQIFKENSAFIGIKMQKQNEIGQTTVFPIANGFFFENSLEPTVEPAEPTVLLPVDMFDELPKEKLSIFEAAMAQRIPDHLFFDHMNIFMLDRLGMMQTSKSMKDRRNEDVKKGLVNRNTVSLRENNSINGCLIKMKGSLEWKENLKEEIKMRQCQNGLNNVKFKWRVCQGLNHAIKDEHLAACLLKMKHLKIVAIEKQNDEKKMKVACCETCNPFDCQLSEDHLTPAEFLKDSFYDVEMVPMTRFIWEKVDNFIRKIIIPIATEFYFFLFFRNPKIHGDSGIDLCGQIWISELSSEDNTEEFDVIPSILSEQNLIKLLGDGGGKIEAVNKLVNWKENRENIQEQRKININFDEKCNTKEVSLLEALFCTMRDMPIKWSSQSVVYFNTNDPRTSIKYFRKAMQQEENEIKYFHAKESNYWIEEDNITKDYMDRPLLAEPIIGSQFGAHYRELEDSNKNYDEKLSELKKLGGIQASTDIIVTLITNREKYPQNKIENLPSYILIRNKKILVLKKNKNILKYNNPETDLTSLLLFEPWRKPEDIGNLEEDPEIVRSAKRRGEEFFCDSCDFNGEETESEN